MQKLSGLTLIAFICFSSCNQAEQSALNFDKISLNIDRASAANCVDEICKSINMKISVTNSSTQPVCTSTRYINNMIIAYLFFLNENGDLIQDFVKQPFTIYPFPPEPGKESDYIKFLETEEPNIIIRPSSTLKYITQTPDIYEFGRSQITVVLQYYIFSCQNGSSQFKMITARSPIKFDEGE